jgi:hypothetical protein
MSFMCPNGHVSVGEDYCDICGMRIGNPTQQVAPLPTSVGPARLCPVCSTPKDAANRYCECGFDFEAGDHLAPPALELVLGVNGSRFGQPGCPEVPEDLTEHVFGMEAPTVLIGRQGADVPIFGDPYVSRRQAELVQGGDGWGIRDLESTNGTKVNGLTLESGELRALKPGDVIDVGFFSRLRVRCREPRPDQT